MYRIPSIVTVLLSAAALSSPAAQLQELSTAQLEQELSAIDTELSQLAEFSLRGGVGSLGHHAWKSKKEDQVTVEIDLGRDMPVDQIVLVPILWRDGKSGFRADGFPAEFRIITGTADNPTGTLLGTYRADDGILPRVAPWIADAHGVSASWVRIEVTKLSRRSLDDTRRFQLSEILIFSGEENAALRRPVKVSPAPEKEPHPDSSWSPQYLTDGHMPYVMDAARGGKSNAYLGTFRGSQTFTVDLGPGTPPLSRLHLHLMDQSDTIPMSFGTDFAIPAKLIVEGANLPDFSDAVKLLEFERRSVKQLGPIMMWPLPETACRYVRLRAPANQNSNTTIGFTEIELFSEGRNVAKGRTFKTSIAPNKQSRMRRPEALTDGLNFYGEILPVRTWINQLARRHDLESERPFLKKELNRRYALQKANLTRLSWLAAALTAGIGFTVLALRLSQMRRVARLKERFAADLHDELGANIHTINLLSELAENKAGKLPDDVAGLIGRIRSVTTESGTAIRHLINMQEAKALYSGLKKEMEQAAERIVTSLEHELTIEGEEFLPRLNPRTRVDLLLFYKECLVNICRHSGATRLTTQMQVKPRGITLAITDNGRGVSDAVKKGIPPSLKRRARLLRAKLFVERPPDGGTRIILKLRTHPAFGFRT